MIGLDTNVIVRYLTQDDPIQSARATSLFERELTEEKPGFISVVAMVETVWVLDRAYGASRAALAEVVESLLRTSVLLVECEQEVYTAMLALKSGEGSFSDAMIAVLGLRSGCSTTVTFDRQAMRLLGFSHLP